MIEVKFTGKNFAEVLKEIETFVSESSVSTEKVEAKKEVKAEEKPKAETKKASKAKKEKKAEPKEETVEPTAKEQVSNAEEKKDLDYAEDIRPILQKLARQQGGTHILRRLTMDFGVSTLSEVKDLPKLLEAAKAELEE